MQTLAGELQLYIGRIDSHFLLILEMPAARTVSSCPNLAVGLCVYVYTVSISLASYAVEADWLLDGNLRYFTLHRLYARTKEEIM